MDALTIALVGLFLPLFPFSMVLTALFSRVDNIVLRLLVLAAWPLAGLALVERMGLRLQPDSSDWLMAWALGTSALYALRLLTLRELNRWTVFFAASAWPLLWVGISHGDSRYRLLLDALSFSAPLLLLAVLAQLLTRRFGAAYTELYNGIADILPRLSTVLVLSVLAAIATPLFPSFFTLLSLLMQATPVTVTVLLLIWLLWSWAGIRLLQGFIVGEPPASSARLQDIGPLTGSLLAVTIAGLMVAAIGLTGEWL